MQSDPIQTLARHVYEDLKKDLAGANVLGLLADYARNHDDWKRYAHFNVHETKYARNLVVRNELFEMLLLCWKGGQSSPIHNHEGSNCWMAILEGGIEECYYAFPNGNPEALPQGEVQRYEAGTAGYISDDIALHLIRPTGDQGAISLHLYSLPFDECNIYCPDTGEVTRTKLGYYTVHGEPVGA